MERSFLQEMTEIAGREGFEWGTARLDEEVLKEARGGIDFSALPYALSIAVPFPQSIINQVREGPSRTYLYYYNVVNTQIDGFTNRIAGEIERRGGQAFPVPASQRVGDMFESIFPHRTAARAAGLGWIGRSCHLINSRRGPRLRLGTILTDLPLPEGEVLENRCGNCRACVEICPPGAIKGPSFSPDIPFEDRFDPQACHDYKNLVRDHFGKRVCGLCLAVCPHGQKSSPARGRDNNHPLVPPRRKG